MKTAKDLYYMCLSPYNFDICKDNVCYSGLCPLNLICKLIILSQNMILDGIY